ncbi:hypothetical protein BSLG_010471 [Batrachochytrium salamandrivorans]|nr:hypothetical protein BASA62_000288 [Batrachochytrium salamandrivorans]KAH6583631.1 hypothetical protein BASA60_001350 [Batrachochytrium salamandrivorans]KAH9274823.1 hypothetical protein BASA83_002532 [Batrachochytrium salamandrivorans]KAJ1327124.1 hypothetical protein BSLG_010471 [Batrachochytrium salamandrivorans]
MTLEQASVPTPIQSTSSPVKTASPMDKPAASGSPSAATGSSSSAPVHDLQSGSLVSGMSLADVPALLAAGTQAFAMGNFSLAAEKLSVASQIQTESHGQKSLESAETLFLYGRALLANVVQKNSLLGENMGESSAVSASDDVATSSTSLGKTGHFVFNGDGDDERVVDDEAQDGDNDAQAEEAEGSDRENEDEDGVALADIDEEDPDDLEIAWETFDLVRIIYSESDEPANKQKLGEVYMALGDVSLESGNFEQAITDFLTALRIKEESLSGDDRELAEAHYKLALALEYSEQTEDAIEQVTQTIDVLQKHLAKLCNGSANGDAASSTGKGKGAAEPVSEAVAKEIKEVETLLAEMSAKIFDLGCVLEKEQNGETIGDSGPSDDVEATKPVAVSAQDVSGLVKKGSAATTTPSEPKRSAAETDPSEHTVKKTKVTPDN